MSNSVEGGSRPQSPIRINSEKNNLSVRNSKSKGHSEKNNLSVRNSKSKGHSEMTESVVRNGPPSTSSTVSRRAHSSNNQISNTDTSQKSFSIRDKPFSTIIKTEIVRLEKPKRKKTGVTLYEEQQNVGACVISNMAVVKLELENTSEIEPHLESQRMCRSRKSKPVQRVNRTKLKSEINLDRKNKKLENAATLLVEKLNKRLLKGSSMHEREYTIRLGGDTSKRYSQVGFASGTLEKVSTSKFGASKTPSAMEKETKAISDELSYHKKKPNQDVEEYLKEPMFEHVFRNLGILNEAGELLSELKDFDEVEHRVKKFLVENAKQLQNTPAPTLIRGRDRGNTGSKPVLSVDKNAARRAQMHKVLTEDINPMQTATSNLPACTRMSESNSQRWKSMPQEHIDKIVERFQSGLEEDDDRKFSMLEILAFQDRDSFDQDAEARCIMAPQESRDLLDERIHGLFYDVEDENDIIWNVEGEAAEMIEGYSRKSFKEWENIRLSEDLRRKKNLNKKEKNLLATAKYFYKWLNKVRQTKSLYDCIPCPFTSLWAGPYPPYIVSLIRQLEQNPKYVPKSRKEFFGKVRKMQVGMYDSILGNCNRAKEKDEIQNLLPEPLTIETLEEQQDHTHLEPIETLGQEDAPGSLQGDEAQGYEPPSFDEEQEPENEPPTGSTIEGEVVEGNEIVFTVSEENEEGSSEEQDVNDTEMLKKSEPLENVLVESPEILSQDQNDSNSIKNESKLNPL